jgi:hypothetical protein
MSCIRNPEGVKAVLRAPQSAVGGDFLRRHMSTRFTCLNEVGCIATSCQTSFVLPWPLRTALCAPVSCRGRNPQTRTSYSAAIPLKPELAVTPSAAGSGVRVPLL